MKIIKNLSISILLTVIFLVIFILLWSAMTWKIYQDFESDLIATSLEFMSHDLASLQLDMQYKSHENHQRALSSRAVNIRYKVLASINEKGYITHASQLALRNQPASNTLPDFDRQRFIKTQQMHQADIRVEPEHQCITAYFPLLLKRHENEIRPTSTGVLFAVYDLNQDKIKILNRVKSSGMQIGLLLLLFMLILLLFINHFVTSPIREIVTSTNAISDGQLGVRNQIHGTREIAILGQTFNDMSMILEARFVERIQTEDKLREHRDHLEELVQKRTEELTKANVNLKKLSEIDPLTQIYNRRKYEHRLAQEVISGKRTGKPLSIMIIDIDYFKGFNDHYGHDAGDITLKFVAQTIKETVPRKTDLVARFGGEEFVVLMPATEKQGAYIVAENIRTNIKALAINHDYSDVTNIITVSIGISSLSGDSLNEEELFKQADLALYAAKEAGRNQCELYS